MLKTNLRLLVFDILFKSLFVPSCFLLGVFFLSVQLSRRDFIRLSTGAAVTAGLGLISPAPALAEPISIGVALGAFITAMMTTAGLNYKFGTGGVADDPLWRFSFLGGKFQDHMTLEDQIIAENAARRAAAIDASFDAAAMQLKIKSGELAQSIYDWAEPAIMNSGRMALDGYDSLTDIGFLARAAFDSFVKSQLNLPTVSIHGVDLPATTVGVEDLAGFPALLSTYSDVLPAAYLAEAGLLMPGATVAMFFISKWTNTSGVQYRVSVMCGSSISRLVLSQRGSNMELQVAFSGDGTCGTFSYDTQGNLTRWKSTGSNSVASTWTYTVVDGPYGLGVGGTDPSIDYLPGMEKKKDYTLDPPMPWDSPVVGGDLVIDGDTVSRPGSVAIPGVLGQDGTPLPDDSTWNDALWGTQTGVVEWPLDGTLEYPWSVEGTQVRVGTLEGVQARSIADAISTPTSIAIDVPASTVPQLPINPITPPVALPPWGGVGDFPLLNIFPFNMTITLVNFLGRVFNG